MASILIEVVNGKTVFVPNVPDGQPGAPMKVARGALLTWNNQTPEVHHPVAIDPPGFLTDEIPPDDVSDPQFNVTKPVGTKISYMCSRHPENDGEKGIIEVV